MAISRKNITIAGIATVSVLVVIAVVVVVLLCTSDHEDLGIFKRCGGYTGPVNITISSCQNSAEVGYCEMRANDSTRVEFTFTPVKHLEHIYLNINAPKRKSVSYCACWYHITHGCPVEAGRKEMLTWDLDKNTLYEGDSGMFRLDVSHEPNEAESIMFCVEFPAKIV